MGPLRPFIQYLTYTYYNITSRYGNARGENVSKSFIRSNFELWWRWGESFWTNLLSDFVWDSRLDIILLCVLESYTRCFNMGIIVRRWFCTQERMPLGKLHSFSMGIIAGEVTNTNKIVNNFSLRLLDKTTIIILRLFKAFSVWSAGHILKLNFKPTTPN